MGKIWTHHGGGIKSKIRQRDGKQIFYVNGESVYVVDVETEGRFRAGLPHLFFEGIVLDDAPYPFDVAPDGRLLLRLPFGDQEAFGQLRVVENWFEELKRLAPVEN